MARCAAALALTLFLAGCAVPVRGPQEAPDDALDDDEAHVLASVISAVARDDTSGWVMVAGVTSTFECDPPANTGFVADGCGGMRLADQAPEDVLDAMHKAVPAMAPEAARDLLQKSRKSIRLPAALPMALKHVVHFPGETREFPSPQPRFWAYPSRVGFNAARDRAVLYLGVVHWLGRTQSQGLYLYLEKRAGEWVERGRFSVWTMQGPERVT